MNDDGALDDAHTSIRPASHTGKAARPCCSVHWQKKTRAGRSDPQILIVQGRS